YRDAVRALLATDSPVGRYLAAVLAARPEALAQPPRFAAVLGQLSSVPVERRRMALEAALPSRPDDLVLLMSLGATYPIRQKDGADARLRWYQAATAAHPRSAVAHTNLGIALFDKGDLDGAIAEYEKAIKIDETSVSAWNNLGSALYTRKREGDLDAA